jgi:hypothetical protein
VPHEPHGQQQQAHIANDLCAVRRLPRRDIATPAEAPAVNAEASCSGGGDGCNEDQQEYGTCDGYQTGGDPGEQQDSKRDLGKRKTPSDDGHQ